MSYVPPEETKTLYPSVPPEQQQQQQQPGGYYPTQQPVGPTAPAGQTVTYYPPSGPPQQQPQQLVISSAPPVVVEQSQPRQSFICHIIFSCIVVCCAWPCGLVAFILAAYHCVPGIACEVIAACKSASEPQSARQLGKASMALSITGLVIGIILIIVTIILTAVGAVTIHY